MGSKPWNFRRGFFQTHKINNLLSKVSGGGKQNRTADLLHAMQALYQLSYTPIMTLGH
jgi:hypothetical protein